MQHSGDKNNSALMLIVHRDNAKTKTSSGQEVGRVQVSKENTQL